MYAALIYGKLLTKFLKRHQIQPRQSQSPLCCLFCPPDSEASLPVYNSPQLLSSLSPRSCAPEFSWLCHEFSLWYSARCHMKSRFTQRGDQGQCPFRYVFKARVCGRRRKALLHILVTEMPCGCKTLKQLTNVSPWDKDPLCDHILPSA